VALLAAAVLAGCASSGSSAPAGSISTLSSAGGGVGTAGSASASAASIGGGGQSIAPTGDSSFPPDPNIVRAGVVENGHRLVARVGQQVIITLGPNWTAPQIASGSALRVVSSVGYPATAGAATFAAIASGVAVVTSQTDFACRHAALPCEIAQQSYRLTIDVTT
jgi:hypothetical protein